MCNFVVGALAIAGVVIVLLRVAELTETFLSGVLPPANSYDAGFARRPLLTLLHIIAGFIFVVLGPLQFVTKIRTRHINLHRWCGRIYVASALVVGVTALGLGIFVGFGGAVETAAVTVFSLLFLVFLGRALFHIRRLEVPAHREWMIRAFALGLSVVTMRPLIGLLSAFTNFSFAESLGVSFWVAFPLHLALAETWVVATRAQRKR
jgi:uncharacterized membrane protein